MDCDGHPENVLSRDELLDGVLMYWLPASGASSARICRESFATLSGDRTPITVATGVSIYPHEILRASQRWCEERYTQLSHHNTLDKGDHFAVCEQPDLFASELRTCCGQVR